MTLTPQQSELSRRAFIAGAGGVVAAPYLLTPRSAVATTHPTYPVTDDAYVLSEMQALNADLSIRWRHLEQRVHRDGLVAAWPLNEGSGYTFADVTGRGHVMAVTGSRWNTKDSGLTAAVHRRGRRGAGIYLDGTRWLQVQNSPELVGELALTLSLWVRPDELPGNPLSLIRHDGAHRLDVTPAGAVRLTVTDVAGSDRAVRTHDGLIQPGVWTHLMASADGTQGKLRLSVSGSQVASTGTGSFTIARPDTDLVVGDGLVGTVDEITVHDKALTSAATDRLYTVGLPAVYTQARATTDDARRTWSAYSGSEPVPHFPDESTVFTARFDGSLLSEQGTKPRTDGAVTFAPARFGAGAELTGSRLTYASPVRGDTGTFEAWYQVLPDPDDARRDRRKELVRLEGEGGELRLATAHGRWQVELDPGEGEPKVVEGPPQSFDPGQLEHIAVSWGRLGDRGRQVALFVNGAKVGEADVDRGVTTFDRSVVIGGGSEQPAFCLLDDIVIAKTARGWGQVCPHGQAATEAAGLDLRDSVDRPSGHSLVRWSPGTGGRTWGYSRRAWEKPSLTGDDPARASSVHEFSGDGVHALFHPDAVGGASSMESSVAFDTAGDGWAGIFVQSPDPAGVLDGYTFALNPATNQLRLTQHRDGQAVQRKVLKYDFKLSAHQVYTLILTSAGDGVVRGFVDGHNLISIRAPRNGPSSGWAGLFTENTRAHFDDVHFSALTPARKASRRVQVRVLADPGAMAKNLGLGPFRWHKRPGWTPWEYERQQQKDPEPPGNIAGADTSQPDHPIPPAFWRAEDSANSDVTAVDGRVIYFMRGNPRVDEMSYGARIGVLDTPVSKFDGIHFDDPSIGCTDLDRCKLLQGRKDPLYPEVSPRLPRLQVNNQASAYVGGGRLLVLAQEKRGRVPGYPRYSRLVYSHYDVHANDWVYRESQYMPWSSMDPADPDATLEGINGTPELVGRRDPDSDEFKVILFYKETEKDGRQVMATRGLRLDSSGVPQLDPAVGPVKSISRTDQDDDGRRRATKAIYNFRVMFDNGIYYLHYSEGPNVPDWPTHFVLAATLDPHAGPWVVSPDTDRDDTTYFRRGTEWEPDNAAIWQGHMVKHRGRYYMYYENFHAIEDRDRPYQHYHDPQAGSRVGFATGN